MNNIMAVRCPACDERVEGNNSEDLSRSIKTHFAEVHDMDIDVEMNTSDEGCGCGGAPGPAEDAGDVQSFECPVCQREIGGSDEDERSKNLREHLTTTHKDEPLITQLMETVSDR
jgi:predicted small metal-binding protein